MAFDDKVYQASQDLVPATADNVNKLSMWIDNLSPGGSTNFRDSLLQAFKKLRAARNSECFSTKCKAALLFLTDGTPDDWDDATDLPALKQENEDGYITAFTYTLGNGAEAKVTSKIAEEHNG